MLNVIPEVSSSILSYESKRSSINGQQQLSGFILYMYVEGEVPNLESVNK
jgi:hypothetical protein